MVTFILAEYNISAANATVVVFHGLYSQTFLKNVLNLTLQGIFEF